MKAQRHWSLSVIGAWTATFLLLVMLAPRAGAAQVVGGSIGGTVTDDSGGALPGATVTVTNKANGTSQVLTTGERGNYRAVALPPAPYTIAVELSGFAAQKRDIVLTIGSDLQIDMKLGISALAESLTVVAQTPLVEVAKSQPSSVVVADQVAALPVLQRNFLTLAQLLPSTTPNNLGQKFAIIQFGGPADQRNGYTTIIDGGDIDDAIWGNPTINIPQDAVQEFKVFRNQFDAEYGSALAAVVSVVTKSGGNQFSGTGSYFGRDKALNAPNYFATGSDKPPFSQTRVGGTIGGPIAANRTHFFGSYEHNDLSTVKIIALPATNPFAATNNGQFPSGSRNWVATTKVDHQVNDHNSLFVRWAHDDQYATRTANVSSDSRQDDDYSHMHSVIVEDDAVLSHTRVNSIRFQFMNHDLGTVPHSYDLSIARPSASFGQDTTVPQDFPRNRYQLFDTFYINTPNHDLKFGGDFEYAHHEYDAHFFQAGYFQFTTDLPFDVNNSKTYPISFTMQTPGHWTFNSKSSNAFVEDTWRVADRVRLNLGLRYHFDADLRLVDYFNGLLANPLYPNLNRFISPDRGNDYTNFQPRLGITWDVRGEGTLVARAGLGKYTTRNRQYFQMTTQDRTLGTAVLITDPNLMKFYPNINAVLGGKSLTDYVASGGARSLFLIDNGYVLPFSWNATAGFGWQLNKVTSLDVDYVHDLGLKQLGAYDLNLPASGAISAANPRPVTNFSEVKVMQNNTSSWYDAVETQLRTRVRGADSLQVSYTLAFSTRDGVNHYQNYFGTMRTPQQSGYQEGGTRHNLTVSGSTHLPYDLQVSGIVRWLSGSPFGVQAGVDLDGDGQTQSDRPAGLPITVGMGDVASQLAIINAFRASRNLTAITPDMLDLDPYLSVDLRLTRQVRLGGTRRVDLFIEGYNLTNHVNFSPGVSANMNAAAFLSRTSAGDPRQIQWGLRFAF
ncbi:MAG: TonB-dependent receptor [Acidobacteria bacterium]|nr:TonB-dependent receptor [Acidobacteriota bacterium]